MAIWGKESKARELTLRGNLSGAGAPAHVRRDNWSVLRCVECGRIADPEAGGWRAYRDDVPDEGDAPSAAMYCPECAAREFGPDDQPPSLQ